MLTVWCYGLPGHSRGRKFDGENDDSPATGPIRCTPVALPTSAGQIEMRNTPPTICTFTADERDGPIVGFDTEWSRTVREEVCWIL
jgi:hypothetical protein